MKNILIIISFVVVSVFSIQTLTNSFLNLDPAYAAAKDPNEHYASGGTYCYNRSDKACGNNRGGGTDPREPVNDGH